MAGLYMRLSREDGDRPESDSIINQQRILSDYCTRHPEFKVVAEYSDDGYTGTNFDRPGFRRMLADIEAGKLDCVLVKDLSRFGRDYIDMGFYLERRFPSLGVRFIAVNEGIDSENGYDLLLPMKNVFNSKYAKDISLKVRSAFRAKQTRGEFIGAFASYGYVKNEKDNDKLVIDPPAAQVVRRIFTLFESGMGKVAIAKMLNKEGIPCPSIYKRQMGMKYNNGRRLDETSYWTYATVNRILKNPMYVGDMVQGKSVRPTMHGKAKAVTREEWILVKGTHDAIISREQWERVQSLLEKRGWTPDFEQNISIFAGFLKCGDCGRAMAKTTRTYNGSKYITYNCGSHKRYGVAVCTPHTIHHETLEDIILADLNNVISSVRNLRELAEQVTKKAPKTDNTAMDKLRLSIERIRRLKKGTYEDYKEGIITKADFMAFHAEYEKQEESLKHQLTALEQDAEEKKTNLYSQWVERLLSLGYLERLDRQTLVETVKEIRIFEDRRIEITYLFSGELEALMG
ncbi:MAG: recombinase family protein [Clostridiales bacterium]|nr:recombinase family protein [Clostridiales bacterium]